MQDIKPVKKHKIARESFLEAPQKICVLVTVVDRTKAEFFKDVLEGYDINLQLVVYGRGTAPTEMLQYLGLSQQGKAVIFSIVKEEKVKEIMMDYEYQYFKVKNGKGIAFTISISSIIGVFLYQFLSNQIEGKKD